MYQFVEIRPEDARFDLFLSVPRHVFPYYKRQLAQKNQINSEYLETSFVLLKHGIPAGRVAIYLNPHLSIEGMIAGGIGNYECVEDLEASRLLLDRALEALAEREVSYVIGPFNGSTWDDFCFLTGHAHPNFFLEPFNPIYYNEQFQAYGFQTISTRVSRIDRDLSGRHRSVEEKEERLRQAGVQFRTIRLDQYESELASLHLLLLKCFQDHHLFSPISWEGFREKYLPLKAWIDPDLVLIAEDREGKMAGMFFCIQDFLNLDEQSLVAKTVARAPGEEWQGLGDVMLSHMYERARKKGFQTMVHAFMNPQFSSRVSIEYAGEVYKTYALYGMKVAEGVQPSQQIIRSF